MVDLPFPLMQHVISGVRYSILECTIVDGLLFCVHPAMDIDSVSRVQSSLSRAAIVAA